MRGLNRLGYSERKACALDGFARSSYYGIKFHRPSDRDMHQLLLEDAIKEISHDRVAPMGDFASRRPWRSNGVSW